MRHTRGMLALGFLPKDSVRLMRWCLTREADAKIVTYPTMVP